MIIIDDLIKLISDNGIMVVIAGIFLWQSIVTNKNNVQTLQILKENSDNTIKILAKLDDRDESIKNNIIEILATLKSRPCIYQDNKNTG